MAEIVLPVSIGEALDKLTILDIKKEKISDPSKNAAVCKERDLLYAQLERFIRPVQFYYDILCHTNKKIWETLDTVKNPRMSPADKLKTYEIIWDDNDRRYRIKNKINNMLNSSIKEQKGYAARKAFVLHHLGMGDMIYCVGMVRYLSTLYDEVKVVCKRKYLANVRQMYSDDPSIVIYPVEGDRDISVKLGAPPSVFQEATAGHDVFVCGDHLGHGKYYQAIPYEFYDDVKIDRQVFWTYFHVNLPSQLVPPDVPYVFVQANTSEGKLFDTSYVENTVGTVLIVDPTLNHYPQGHPNYEIAESYAGKNLFEYADIMCGASKILLADSSFMCLAWHLPLKTSDCFVCSRGDRSYSHLWRLVDVPRGKRVFKHVYLN